MAAAAWLPRPITVAGSVSHKHDAALALMAPRSAVAAGGSMHVGVDLEHRPTARDVARPSIARRILTAPELDALSALDADPLAQRSFYCRCVARLVSARGGAHCCDSLPPMLMAEFVCFLPCHWCVVVVVARHLQ